MPHRIAVDRHLHDDRALGRDLWGDFELEHRFAELDDRSRQATRLGLIGQLGALLDHRLGLVTGQHTRAGDHLAALIGFECRKLQVDEPGRSRAKQADRNAGGRDAVDAGCRQIHEVGVVDAGGPTQTRRIDARQIAAQLRGQVAHALQVARHRGVHVAAQHGGTGTIDWHIHRHGLTTDRIELRAGPRDGAADVVEAPLHAQVAREAIVGLDNAGLDQDLTHRHVELTDDAANFIQARSRVAHEHRIGPFISDHAAALGHELLLVVTEQLLNRVGLLIVEPEGLDACGLDLGDLLARFQVEFFLRGQLITRRHEDHVAIAPHIKILRLQNNIERLIPGHIFQAQREVAGDRLAHHDVEVGEIGDDLQQGAHVDVLEIERQLVAAVAGARACAGHGTARVFACGLHLDDELRIALISVVLERAGRLDHHAGVLALLESAHRFHRRGEIGHIESAPQIVGQAGLLKVDDDRLALLANVDPGLGVGQLHDDAPFPVGAPAKIDIAQGMAHRCIALGERETCRGQGRRTGRVCSGA